jgi:DNA-binding GntR family transcriptional regulator
VNAGATADRVYEALKRRLLSGAYLPGQRLEPVPIAEDLISSVTPVRDALNRLIGERLVETHSGTGFHVFGMHEPDLRDLYAWHAQLALNAIRWWPTAAPSIAVATGRDPVAGSRAIFHALGASSLNAELQAAVAAAADRLEAVRHVEPLLLPAIEDELDHLAAALRAGERAEATRLIRAYHRRRVIAVPGLIRALYRPLAGDIPAIGDV